MARLGKGVLENLTLAMYDDSRIIYREYIQNSSDQIDIARKEDSFPNEKLEIVITLDIVNRNIFIKDNANGIPAKEVEKRLGDVADSEKVQGENKGFRGIGRLGGIGYCKELRFVTTYRGESTETTMIWNAQRLHEIITDASDHTSAENILNEVITYESQKVDKNAHYFEVQMLGVDEADDKLLDYDNVKQYISEVAPVDYTNTFIYSSKVYDFIKENDEVPPLTCYDISIRENDGEIVDIYKEYPTSIYKMVGVGKNAKREKIDDVKDIHADILRDSQGKPIAWIWYAITAFQGQINDLGNPWRCLRLRQFNIQIGNNNTLSKYFKETRGNGYFLGEVHTINKKLRPNARRDWFNESLETIELEKALREYFKKLTQIYKMGSDLNSGFRKIANADDLQKKFVKKDSEGKFVNKEDREKAVLSLQKAKDDAENGIKVIEKYKQKAKEDGNSAISKIVDAISKKHKEVPKKIKHIDIGEITQKPKNILVDKLSSMNKKERKLVSKIYEIIKKNLENEVAEELINKIQEELKNG